MVYWSLRLGQGWLLSNHFCKACQNCLHPNFLIVHKAVRRALIVALLWKLPQMPSCSTNNANLDKNNFYMFYQIDCCTAIHGRIWMNNVPNKSWLIMLSCTEFSFVIYFFSILGNLESNRVSFYAIQSSYLLKNWGEIIILACFYKKLLLSSHLLSNMHDQCVIWKRNNSTVIPKY